MRAPGVALMCVLVAFSASSAGAASPEVERKARRSYERGEEHFRAGRFAEALGEVAA